MLKRKHRIIPILLEDITSVKSRMDKNLKGIIDSVTYLEWPGNRCDKKMEKFWKRLTLSLPKKKESLSLVDSSIVSSSNMNNNCVSFSSQSRLCSSSGTNNSWLTSDSVINSNTTNSESIYFEIRTVDEKLNVTVPSIPTLSEKEEEEMIENYKKSQKCNSDNTEVRLSVKDIQSQVSYNQSEVSSPTDSLTPLWIDKANDIIKDTVEDKGIRRYLELLDDITEV